MHISAMRFCAETVLIPPANSRSRFSPGTYLQRSASPYGEKCHPHICLLWLAVPSAKSRRRMSWASGSMVDGSESNSSESSSNRTARLVRNIQAFQKKLSARIKQLKKGLPTKILFFLVGFYCATAFATVIGQTGDWDILSAGLAVVIVEVIGALMYRASLPLVDKIRHLVTIFNYWKAGLSLGLFLDAFKYEIESFYESCNSLNIEMDLFPIFW